MKADLIFIIGLIVLTSLCDTITQLSLKSSINSLNTAVSLSLRKLIRFFIRLLKVPLLWLGFLFSILSLCIWLFVLSRVDLNFAFSVDSMHYIFIAFASKVLLKEKVGFLRWAGTIFIIIGIIFVSLS